jgi:D-aspartate ligase
MPPGVGTCRIGEAVWVDEVVEQGLALLRGIGFRGLSQVEFKRDARDGRYKLMEINPRLWQWHGLAAAAGVDLTRIAYLDLIGQPPAPVRMNGRPRRWAITLAPGERPVFVRPPYVDGVLARDDLRPALTNLARVARRVVA